MRLYNQTGSQTYIILTQHKREPYHQLNKALFKGGGIFMFTLKPQGFNGLHTFYMPDLLRRSFQCHFIS